MHILGVIIGCLLLAALLIQAGLLLKSAINRYVTEKEQQRLFLQHWQHLVDRAKVQLTEATDRVKGSWKGFRKFEVKRKVFENANHSICSFYLWPRDEKPLPLFNPGQFLTFDLSIPGQKKPVKRCYSLSDKPDPDYYRVTIKKLPHGRSSGYFHDQIREGDYLDVRAPAGNFCIEMADNFPIVLLAGGVGVTPFLSMLNAVKDTESSREAWLFYAVRNLEDKVMRHHLERLDQENENIHIHVCCESMDDGLAHSENYHQGRISMELLDRLLPSNNYTFYLCGPGGMMKAMNEGLRRWGVPENMIHAEAFGAASLPSKKQPEKMKTAAEALNITFSKSGKTLPWDAEAGTILDFAEQHGIFIDCACKAGSCGTCQTAIRQGDVSYLKDPEFAELEEGSCLTCICAPKANLVLDA